MDGRPYLFHNLLLLPRLLHWYQIILLGVRSTWMWTTCPELLPDSGMAGIELTTSRSWIRCPNHYATIPPYNTPPRITATLTRLNCRQQTSPRCTTHDEYLLSCRRLLLSKNRLESQLVVFYHCLKITQNVTGPLCENMTSYSKSEVYNLLQCCQNSTEPWTLAKCRKNVKFSHKFSVHWLVNWCLTALQNKLGHIMPHRK